MPSCLACAAACVLFATPNFEKILLRWRLTVAGAMTNACAIAAFVAPSTSKSSTSSSRSLKGSSRGSSSSPFGYYIGLPFITGCQAFLYQSFADTLLITILLSVR
jgi:hypothetical protein